MVYWQFSRGLLFIRPLWTIQPITITVQAVNARPITIIIIFQSECIASYLALLPVGTGIFLVKILIH